MNVLALEPFYGGSHRAFLDGWIGASRHRFTVLGLPAYKWKWRMRHAAITLAEQSAELADKLADEGQSWDVLFCSDMLNLAEFLGLARPAIRRPPCVAYFHENQLTYPVQREDERDGHFGFTNITTALAASQVWFNSAFHRDEFLDAAHAFLRRMPDHQPLTAVEQIRGRSRVQPPGVGDVPPRGERKAGPLRVLWAARWEFDKNPEMFFEALEKLDSRGVDFRLSVIGESFCRSPPVFEQARRRFAERIDRWGHQSSREAYEAALAECDVFVSTADHEFFGISAVEAMAAGAYPLLPRRLAYPELLLAVKGGQEDFFHDGTAEHLAARLQELAGRASQDALWQGAGQRAPDRVRRAMARFQWKQRAAELDDALQHAAAEEPPSSCD